VGLGRRGRKGKGLQALLEIRQFIIVRAAQVSLGTGPPRSPEGGSEAAGSGGLGPTAAVPRGGLGVSPPHLRAPGRPGPSHAPRTPRLSWHPPGLGLTGNASTVGLCFMTAHKIGAAIS